MGAKLCRARLSGSEKPNELIKNKRKQFQPLDHKRASKATLEDLLLSSPDVRPECIAGGELHVFRHLSRKLHPSSTRVHANVATRPCRSRDSLTSETILKSANDANSEVCVNHAMRRSQSGKLKKVSFRFPHEAETIIFHSPVSQYQQEPTRPLGSV